MIRNIIDAVAIIIIAITSKIIQSYPENIKNSLVNGARIGKNVLIGAQSLITEGKEIPDNSLVIGSPGRVVRELSKTQIKNLMDNANNYVKRAERYSAELKLDNGR